MALFYSVLQLKIILGLIKILMLLDIFQWLWKWGVSSLLFYANKLDLNIFMITFSRHYLWVDESVPSALSKFLKVALTEKRVFRGRTAIIPTIIMGKMEIVFPDMYMMNMFIGACLMGPRARSQERLALRLAAPASVWRLVSALSTDAEYEE